MLELLKPITWFPPMWAFLCGVASSGAPLSRTWPMALAGMVLAGPALCGASQVVNDWFDRHVDAINEPNRPIPSGRVPGRWGLGLAILWTCLSLGLAATLGPVVLAAAAFGLILAWLYSAPPLRLKAQGWWGLASVALCYEGLAWFTGAAATLRAFPDLRVVALAGLYSIGAIGIMILNDFKAVEGDRQMGVRTVQIELGIENAAWLAAILMAAPQLDVIALLIAWGHAWAAGLVGAVLAAQLVLMRRFVADPSRRAVMFSGFGVALYVLGMMASGVAVGMAGGVT
jgi:chlorophyll synthase